MATGIDVLIEDIAERRPDLGDQIFESFENLLHDPQNIKILESFRHSLHALRTCYLDESILNREWSLLEQPDQPLRRPSDVGNYTLHDSSFTLDVLASSWDEGQRNQTPWSAQEAAFYNGFVNQIKDTPEPGETLQQARDALAHALNQAISEGKIIEAMSQLAAASALTRTVIDQLAEAVSVRSATRIAVAAHERLEGGSAEIGAVLHEWAGSNVQSRVDALRTQVHKTVEWYLSKIEPKSSELFFN
jgi:hypothetical protein